MNRNWLFRMAVCTAALFAASETYAQYPIGTARSSVSSSMGRMNSRSGGMSFGSSSNRGTNRQFGMAGNRGGAPGLPRGAGGLGSRNRPGPNQSPALSNYLNLLPGAADSFAGQYLLRTMPFDQANIDRSNFSGEISSLQNEVGRIENSPLSGSTGDPIVPISSGLSTTGHPVGFLSTGNYFPAR